MNDITDTELFSDVKTRIISIVEQIKTADNVAIFATADLESIVSLAFLESAMMDANIPYSRKIFHSTKFQPKGEAYNFSSTSSTTISIEQYEETWAAEEIDDLERLRILPLAVSVSHPNSDRQHNGALDVVVQCAAIAALLAPNGPRVRRLRPLAGSGQWLRESLDNSYDPVYSKLRDFLQNEGSIRIVPIPEVEEPITDMIPDFPDGMLRRLAKKWAKMDFQQRGQAMSELALPTLSNPKLSTPRLEELLWFRIIVSGGKSDLHSLIYSSKLDWPDDMQSSKSYASSTLNSLISTGLFS